MQEFNIGDRVIFRKGENNFNRILVTHDGEVGTVKRLGTPNNPRVLVCFDRSDDAFGIWWIYPHSLRKIYLRQDKLTSELKALMA